MMRALSVIQQGKMHCQAEVTPSSENIKPVALAIVELYLSEGIK